MEATTTGAPKLAAQFRKGLLAYRVLAVLRDSPYGVELLRRFDPMNAVPASHGTISPLVAGVSRDGLAGTTWQETRSAVPRRHYELTPRGHSTLREFTAAWPRFRDAVD